MSPLYPSNEWSDINIYQTIGKSLTKGKVLYVDLFDHKGPLIFIIYALAYKLSDFQFFGMFIVLYILWGGVLVHLYKSLNCYVSKVSSFIIAILTIYFSLNYSHTGGSPEEFILIANVYILSVFIRWITGNSSIKKRDLVLLGVFSSMILLLKFNLITIYFCLILGFLLYFFFSKDFFSFFRFIRFYLLGLFGLIVCVGLYLYCTGVLQATIDSYIILNRKAISGYTFYESIRLGVKRLIELFQLHFLGTTLFLMGGFLFPFLYIKSNILKVFFVMAVFSAIIVLYFTGVAQFYYTLPLYAFVPLGLLIIFDKLRIFCTSKSYKLITSASLFIVILLGIYQTKLWNLSLKQLMRQEEMPGVNYQFAKTIKQSDTPSLMVLSFGDAINLFTLCDIFPTNKFFTTLNLSYSIFPDLRNTQMETINNKEVEYIVMNEGAYFFRDYQPLYDNYEIVDTFEGYEEFQNVRIPKRTFLFKRKLE